MKKSLLSLILTLVSLTTFAYDFKVGSIYYNITSSSDKACEVTSNGSSDSYSGAVVIPSSITYNSTTYSVTSIGDDAFYGCSGLTSVTIPNSVTSIGYYAFEDCGGLTSVTIPNSVTSIGDCAFYKCSGLTSVIIGNSVTDIGRYAFYDCYALTKAEFASIESLCKINFNDAQAHPLCYAKNLYIDGEEVKDLVIPNSVTSIGTIAFYGCSGLTSVTIPNSVTEIGYYAFYGCKNLSTVFCHITTPLYIDNVFKECSSNMILYVPRSSVEEYKNSDHWNMLNIQILGAFLKEGTYYIKNVSAKGVDAYLEGGGDWGTHATLGHGVDINAKMCSEYGYMLDTHISLEGDLHYLADIGYMDGNSVMYIDRVNDELYTIMTEGGLYLSAKGNDVNFEEVDNAQNIFWQFITPEQRKAEMSKATKSNPVDATWLIKDPDFSRNDMRITAWEEKDMPVVGGDVTNMNAEKWGGNTNTFTVQQTISVPNGWYELSAQGFYRYNNTTENTNAIAIATHANGTEKINSYLFAGNVSVPLPSIADDEASKKLSALPFSQAEASAAFGKGLYRTSLFVEVKNGILPLGVKKTSHPGTDWTVFDNFELTYYGADNPNILTPKCATPTIDFVNGQFFFNCETEGVKIIHEYSNSTNMGAGTDKTVMLTPVTHTVTVYATAPDYIDSEKVTKTITLTREDMNGDGIVDMRDANIIVNKYLER